MSELRVLQLTYAVSILIVAFAQIFIPRFSGTGLHLGVRFSENNYERAEIKEVIKRFIWLTLGLGVVLAALSFFLVSVFPQNFALQIILLLLAVITLTLPLIWGNRKLKGMKKEWHDPGPKTLPTGLRVISGKDFGLTGNGLWLYLVSLLMIAGSMAYILVNYDQLPQMIPTHFNFRGEADAFSPKSLSNVLSPGIILSVLWIIMLLSNLAVLTAKHSMDVSDSAGSLKRYLQARRIWTIYLAVTTLIFVGLSQIGITYLTFGHTKYASSFTIAMLVLSLLVVIASIWLGIKVGSAGEKLSKTGIISDDSSDENWKLGGLFYYNRNDSAVFAQKRVGVGVTVNLATFGGKVIVGVLLLLILLSLVLLI